MSKADFVVLFLLSNVISICCYFILHQKKSRLHKAMANLAGASALATTAYFFTLFLNTYTALKIAHGIYFSLMSWLCLAILFFITTFTENHHYPKFFFIFFPVLILDSISQMLNIIYAHALSYHFKVIDNEMYFELLPKLPFMIHLGICYLLIGISVLLLIRKTIASPRFYRIQYFTVMSILMLIVSVNAIFLFTNLDVDVSIISYGFAAGMLTFYILFLMPKTLIAKMSGIVLDEMNVAIYLFDISGIVIYRNSEAAGLDANKEADKELVFRKLRLELPDDTRDYHTEVVFKDSSKEQILDMQYIILSEKAKKHEDVFIGSYLIIKDITAQREHLMRREYRATHDELTDLYNRSYFCECAQKLLQEQTDKRYAILMTNFYQFKLFNEVFGQEAGDKLLIASTRNLRKFVQKSNRVVYCRYEADILLSIP